MIFNQFFVDFVDFVARKNLFILFFRG